MASSNCEVSGSRRQLVHVSPRFLALERGSGHLQVRHRPHASFLWVVKLGMYVESGLGFASLLRLILRLWYCQPLPHSLLPLVGFRQRLLRVVHGLPQVGLEEVGVSGRLGQQLARILQEHSRAPGDSSYLLGLELLDRARLLRALLSGPLLDPLLVFGSQLPDMLQIRKFLVDVELAVVGWTQGV